MKNFESLCFKFFLIFVLNLGLEVVESIIMEAEYMDKKKVAAYGELYLLVVDVVHSLKLEHQNCQNQLL